MRKLLISLFLLFAIFCFAENSSGNFEFSTDTTLLQISKQTDIPIKKILQYLELDNSTDYSRSLSELQISNEKLRLALDKYNNGKKAFYSGIVFVGMSIVFLSLIIVGLFISSLKHLNRPKKQKKTIQTSIGKITASTDYISSNAIVAAITAMYLHEAEVEEKNRLNLTWTRSQHNMWSIACMVENKFVDNRREK